MIGNAITETPWLTPDESCKRLKVSRKTFRRHVAPRLKRTKKIGSLWRYHVEEIDQRGEDDSPTSSRSEAMESGTSSGPRPTGVVSIGPLERARAAIDARFPCEGIIFPEFDCRDALRRAALAAGISAHRASRLSIYDFRHGRGTEWGTTGNLIGIAYLMGHKHVTTTKEYLHSNLEEAQAVLFPTSYLTSPAGAAPTTAELIAQATEMIGCGREDSCVTGMRQSRSGHSPRSCRIPGAIRRPLTGAEYTVGRVLVDTYEMFTENPVRKRGLEPPRVLPH